MCYWWRHYELTLRRIEKGSLNHENKKHNITKEESKTIDHEPLSTRAQILSKSDSQIHRCGTYAQRYHYLGIRSRFLIYPWVGFRTWPEFMHLINWQYRQGIVLCSWRHYRSGALTPSWPLSQRWLWSPVPHTAHREAQKNRIDQWAKSTWKNRQPSFFRVISRTVYRYVQA